MYVHPSSQQHHSSYSRAPDTWVVRKLHIHSMQYHSALKSQEIQACLQHGPTSGHFAEWNKLDTKSADTTNMGPWNSQIIRAEVCVRGRGHSVKSQDEKSRGQAVSAWELKRTGDGWC